MDSLDSIRGLPARLLYLLKLPPRLPGGEVTDGLLRDLARARNAVHLLSPTSRPLSPDYELIGLAGERAYSELTGLPMDISIRREGDGRVDFYTPLGTVDVKTARKPVYLLREEGKAASEILVLGFFEEDPLGAELLGWEYDSVLVTKPVRTMRGHTIPNHAIRRRDLRNIAEHLELLRVAALLELEREGVK